MATRNICYQIDKQSLVSFKTLLSYFSLFQKYQINHGMILQLFKESSPSFFIKVSKDFFFHTNTICLLIAKEILFKMIRPKPTKCDKLNIGAALIMVLEGFFCIGKRTFTDL